MERSFPVSVQETTDFHGLQTLFYRNGLEVDLKSPQTPAVLGLWEAVSPEGTRLGAAKLEERSGELVLGCLAIEEPYRGSRVGSALLETALAHCKARGAANLLLVAKVPPFFMSHGFYPVDMAAYQHITKCFTCKQRDVSCFPQVLRFDFPTQ